jgi:hypothetical protein
MSGSKAEVHVASSKTLDSGDTELQVTICGEDSCAMGSALITQDELKRSSKSAEAFVQQLADYLVGKGVGIEDFPDVLSVAELKKKYADIESSLF